MRLDDLIQELQKLREKHGNRYVIIDSYYEGEVSVDRVEIIPYNETKYVVIKS
jgi:hypothetical protein